MLSLVERYLTLGGEAPMSGDPCYIIRFTGCNLDCHYCDTKYNDEENETLSVDELIEIIRGEISSYPGVKILFTGGEPLLGERLHQIMEVIEQIKDANFYIETNGSILLPPTTPTNCHIIADYKSPSSKEVNSFCSENINLFSPNKDCIKFVVSRDDLNWLKEKYQEVRKEQPDLPLFVSPQWESIDFHELADFIISNRLNISLSLQSHKIIWPPEMRGV